MFWNLAVASRNRHRLSCGSGQDRVSGRRKSRLRRGRPAPGLSCRAEARIARRAFSRTRIVFRFIVRKGLAASLAPIKMIAAPRVRAGSCQRMVNERPPRRALGTAASRWRSPPSRPRAQCCRRERGIRTPLCSGLSWEPIRFLALTGRTRPRGDRRALQGPCLLD